MTERYPLRRLIEEAAGHSLRGTRQSPHPCCCLTDDVPELVDVCSLRRS